MSDTLYGQEPEMALLERLLPHLTSTIIVDVGAERGEFVARMLTGEVDRLYAIEPEPENVETLRRRFGRDDRVAVLPYAASDDDREASLRLSTDTSTGERLSYAHTLLERPDTDEVAWRAAVEVPARSLDSLVKAGDIPPRIGILKVDTEGHDLAVLEGSSSIDADVVMVEHWVDLPHLLGPCPWTIDDIVRVLGGRGLRHFVFFGHRGEVTVAEWDEATVPVGTMGNALFLHDRILVAALPVVLELSSELSVFAADYVADLEAVVAERQAVINELTSELDIQRSAAAERLARLESLEPEV